MKKKNQKIRIDLTESDLEDLQDGKFFNWTYATDKGEEIDIHLYNCDNEDNRKCGWCGGHVDLCNCEKENHEGNNG